ncbi:DUF3742 family protein [Pseudomonas lactis]|uniref:DUF3742 family protein n=1 Tax=Pseudomonas lactis TaxID=1615674 RepID=UPI001F2E843D|nr:DUF3742 family protein [Pseudomonas lactis]MCF5127737.1 DUF3742 family protein [Pseudomonas lactis]
MSTGTRISNAERFGCWLGRGWRAYVRRERRVSGCLVAQGVPTPAAVVLIWGGEGAGGGVWVFFFLFFKHPPPPEGVK